MKLANYGKTCIVLIPRLPDDLRHLWIAHRSNTENFLSWLPVSFVSFYSAHSDYMAAAFKGLHVVFASIFILIFVAAVQGKIGLLFIAEKD